MPVLQAVCEPEAGSVTSDLVRGSDRLAAVMARVEKLDFAQIKNKLMVKQGWATELCDLVERLYRQFLALHSLYPENLLVPSPSLDEFWHRHILDTQAYQEDCESVFGRFVHHAPSTGTPEERQVMDVKFAETVELYRIHFKSDPRVTPQDFEAVAHCGCHRCGCRCG